MSKSRPKYALPDATHQEAGLGDHHNLIARIACLLLSIQMDCTIRQRRQHFKSMSVSQPSVCCSCTNQRSQRFFKRSCEAVPCGCSNEEVLEVFRASQRLQIEGTVEKINIAFRCKKGQFTQSQARFPIAFPQVRSNISSAPGVNLILSQVAAEI